MPKPPRKNGTKPIDVAAIILAAGKGTRMKSALPKVMHPIAGQPMVGWVLDTVDEIAATKTVVVTGPDMPELAEYLKARGDDIQAVTQRERKGTADAVKIAATKLTKFKGLVYVLYGDTPFVQPDTLLEMDAVLRADPKCKLVVIGFDAADPTGYGRLVMGKQGILNAIVEEKDASDAQKEITLCNSGVMAFPSEMLPLLEKIQNKNASKEFYLTDLVALVRKAGHAVRVVEATEEEVMGINSRSQLADAEYLIQEWLREEVMEAGVTLIAPETVFLSKDVRVMPDSVIHPYVWIGKNTEIHSGVEVRSFSHIEGAVLQSGAVVGPFARLRPGTVVGENVRVGNFVEVKNSTLDEGAKINHLTYIGDSEVGAHANVGAGVVTCNYDGFEKFKTTIGAGAFIGSNSSLVAPVTIGKGAIVGAGSTILKNVEPDAVAVSETPQRNRKGRAAEIRKQKSKSKTRKK